MKKNIMMRLASFLLIAVLLSTSVISGTFAKYVTAESGSDSARVAKWGVEVTAEGTTFATAYAREDDSLDTTAASRVGVNSVAANEDVVAPGTSGSMATIGIAGTPEVAVQVTYQVDNFDLTGWEVDGVYYCPLIITVNGDDIYGLDYTNVADFQKEVVETIEGFSTYYAAGTTLESNNTHTLSVSWRWNFDDTTEEYDTVLPQSDPKDTALGSATTPAQISLTVGATVTQVD